MTRFTLAAFSVIVLLATSLCGQSNPVPFVNQPLVPTTVVPGSPASTLTVNGTGFVAGSVVNWNGSPRVTTFVNSSQLTAAITAADLASPTTAFITVGSPDGTNSNTTFLQVANPLSVSLSRTDYAVQSEPFVVATADLNRDGKLDLVVTNQGADTVSVLLGNGDGTFQAAVSYATGIIPKWVLVRDFNNDGKVDLAVASIVSAAVSILLGNGDGTFQSHVEYPTGGGAFSLVAGDFNADGKLDVAVANYDSNGTLGVLLGNGDGTFQPYRGFSVGAAYPLAITEGDFNGDGKLDLAVATQPQTGSGIAILLGNGDGTFQAPSYYNLTEPFHLAAADFNGDGKLDLVVAANGSLWSLLGNGDGTFQAPRTVGSPNAIWVAASDFNGDDNLDLATIDQGVSVYILPGDGDGTFQTPLAFPTGPEAQSVATGDFNRDGRPDLVTVNIADQTISVQLQPVVAVVTLSPANLAFAVRLVGTTSASQTVTLTNTSSSSVQISTITLTGANPGDFSETNNCPSSLNAGATCTITVTFKPSAKNVRAADITITDSGSASAQIVSLTGTGTVVSFSASRLNFGGQAVGTRSAPLSFTLKNKGATALTLSGISVLGTNASDFMQKNNCGTSVNAGAGCAVTVVFTPSAAGTRAAYIRFTDNGGGSPQTVPLQGTGK